MDIGLLFAAVGLLFAGLVKGSVGFGLPMIAVPVLTSFVGARTAVVVMSLVNLASAAMLVGRGGGLAWRTHLRQIGPLLGTALVGMLLGAPLLAILDPRWLSALVGLVAVLFSIIATSRIELKVPPAHQASIGAWIGLLTGLLGGTTSVFATPIVLYLHALGLPKQAFVVMLNVVVALASLVQIGAYVGLGLYTPRVLEATGLTLLCVVLGVSLGILVQRRVPQAAFNRAVLVVIFLVGANLIRTALAG